MAGRFAVLSPVAAGRLMAVRAWAIAALCTVLAVPAAAKPDHVVSMNLCADELVIRLLDPQRIASVSWLARQPSISNVVAAAQSLPINRGLAEEIIASKPDLVVAGLYTTRTTVSLLKRVGLPLIELEVPNSIAAVEAHIFKVAALLGEEERGKVLLAEMEAELSVVDLPSIENRPTAIIFKPNGFTAGKGSLVDDILSRAGFRNLAAELQMENYGQVPIETLILSHPDFVIIDAEPSGAPALAYEVLRHPALRGAENEIRTISLPSRLWTCAGPSIVDAVKILVKAREGRT